MALKDSNPTDPAMVTKEPASGVNLEGNGEGIVDTNPPTTERSWLTSLKKDVRARIDIEKYPTLDSFVLAHTDGPKEESVSEETGDVVDYSSFDTKFSEDSDPFGFARNKVVDVLSKSNVPVEVAKNLFDAIEAARTESMTALGEKGAQLCDAKCRQLWGADYDANHSAMERAYVAIVGDDQEFKALLDSTGCSINPGVAQILSKVGNILKEGTPGQSAGSKGSFDSKNPFGY